jgi:pyridoxal phosphate-dependent aminotransferase EpsN
VAQRRRVFEWYRERLAPVSGISLMPEADYGVATRWLTVALIDPTVFGADREDVRLALEREDIESRPVWKPLHLQPSFAGCRRVGGAVAEKLFARGLCLPSGSQMTESDVTRVTDVVLATARSARRIG